MARTRMEIRNRMPLRRKSAYIRAMLRPKIVSGIVPKRANPQVAGRGQGGRRNY